MLLAFFVPLAQLGVRGNPLFFQKSARREVSENIGCVGTHPVLGGLVQIPVGFACVAGKTGERS